MAKTAIEGYFSIPYQGQLRFNAEIVDGEVIFSPGKQEYHQYFKTQPGSTITTYQYDPAEKQALHLEQMKEEIYDFIMGKEHTIVLRPTFQGKLFGKEYTQDGELTITRFYC